ncbi:MAG: hypothetical protein JJU41_09920 [Bacteroidetes bacterium]|nr:hypothetical protein [Bacteroidota bacterium]MCH8523833.1 hypothetical protein [Balneolales bacterium]
MSRRVIDKKAINWQEQSSSKLNYQLIFDGTAKKDAKHDHVAESGEAPAPETPDIEEILHQRRLEEERNLMKARNEAFEEGRSQGHKEGYAKATDDMQHKVAFLEEALRDAHKAWQQNQDILKGDILSLAFEIAEAVVGVPLKLPEIKQRIESELVSMIQELDSISQPVLWVAREDFEFVESLVEEYGGRSGIILRVGSTCKPGEYQLETNKEKVVRDYKVILNDFRESLALPHPAG